MKNITIILKKNHAYLLFSFCFTFFLICSYVFSHLGGFQTGVRLLIILLLSLLLTPVCSILVIKVSNYRKIVATRTYNKIISKLFNSFFFYLFSLFLMHLPVFLAYYPGIYTFDVNVQVEQYEIPYFVQNHPLIHTLFLGFFNNLFETANPGYAIATIIQMLLVGSCMAYALKYMYKKTNSVLLCTFTLLFYGLFPVNSLLTISATKDIIFSACVLVFFVDCFSFFQEKFDKPIDYIRFIAIGTLMILLRNNTIYAFIPAILIILIVQIIQKQAWKKIALYSLAIIILYTSINKCLVVTLDAHTGSIKEMLSIPCQELAHLYSVTDNERLKEEIVKYIPEPENYNPYLSDAIKMQLDSDTFDSATKHFLLLAGICTVLYPIPCIDAIFYNTQGFWDIFHCPYQEEYSFVSSLKYRGEAIHESKFPALCELYETYFHTTETFANTPFVIIFNPGFYIWILLFFFTRGIQNKDKTLVFSCIFPILYLCTLLLSPGAIMRYAFPFVLIAPILFSTIYVPE